MNQIRIVIADDHEIIRMGLKALLNQHLNLCVVGEAATGEEAIREATRYKPDIVVMDIQMPGMSGVDACAKITAQLPDTRVIILTAFAEDELLFAAAEAGAAGYVLKRIGNDDLLRTIEAVAYRESVLDLALTKTMFKQFSHIDSAVEGAAFGELSSQEMRVLALIAEGLTNREIARRLFLSEGTVRNYASTLFCKLQVVNRAEAAAFAVQHKINAPATINKPIFRADNSTISNLQIHATS